MAASIPVVGQVATPEFLSSLALGPACKGSGAMSFFWLQDGPLKMYLCPPGTCDVSIPIEPSVFNGTGDERRKNIVFSVPETTRQAMAAIKAHLQELVGSSDTLWNSCLRAGERHPATLKAKIELAGDHAATILGPSLEFAQLPKPWRRVQANALITVRGVYQQARGAAGLVIQCTALQLGSEEEAQAEALFAPLP